MQSSPVTPRSPLLSFGLPDGVATLSGADSRWGVIEARGADATRFLHSQLTNDLALLQPGEARLAAFCSAKGRMQASFIVVRTLHTAEEDRYLLLCRQDLLAQILKRLTMFKLRSQLTLTDVSAEIAVYGLLGEAARQAWQGDMPVLWAHQQQEQRDLVWLYPSVGQDTQLPRALCLQPAGLPAPVGASVSAQDWELSEVRSGVATVSQATWEAFVPQMINYESVGGVSFKKGCYPGQEVVARSQFRGAIKRRGCIAAGVLADGAALPQAGQDVFLVPTAGAADSVRDGECGLIAQVATLPQDGFELIASLQLHAMEAVSQGLATLHAGSDTGPELQLLPLPYVLLEDI
ncbi:folate-binding protein [Brachymonas sp. G13]|uniref:CAF17-like 4Fe-4S cluster assembly/insertion protein YgfZ n=1 Tax=Brachymonas wangyanguii TaxID=3130163 RepID=UPI00168F9FFD|nr:folate-binding protein YgfZ [Ramlibacter sp.]